MISTCTRIKKICYAFSFVASWNPYKIDDNNSYDISDDSGSSAVIIDTALAI